MTSSLVQRYRKARAACALLHLENWGITSVDGPDARDFLQRLGTQDIRNLADGAAVQTLFLKGDGRLVADVIVYCVSANHFLLLTPALCHDPLMELLERYHFTEQLTIADQSLAFYSAMICGPNRHKVADQIGKSCSDAATECMSAEVTIAPGSSRIILFIPADAFATFRSQVYEAIESDGGVIASHSLYESIRIEEGVPAFGSDLTDKTIPLEAGQKPAISFTKGCFPGQEIVARINNLGNPANVLVGLTLPESTENFIGSNLQHEGKTVGRITSAAFSPRLGGMLGLGYVKWKQREPGTVLTIEGSGNYTAAVAEVPLPGIDLQ